MNQTQTKRLDSYRNVRTFFAERPGVWAGIAPIERVIGEWGQIIDAIDEQARIQERDTTGATRTKEEQATHVIGLAETLTKKLRAFARLGGDADLLPIVDVSRTELDRMNREELVRALDNVTDAARERLADLAPYRVTEAELDTLDAEAGAIVGRKERQQGGKDARTVATAELRTLFARVPPLRDILDDLVDALVEDESFRMGYEQARKVRD